MLANHRSEKNLELLKEDGLILDSGIGKNAFASLGALSLNYLHHN